ncbi:MAG: polysaccharide deacetylase family protein [Gemmatimonadales bacterium]
MGIRRRWPLRYEQGEQLRNLICAIVYFTGAGWVMSRSRRPGAAILLYHSIGGRGIFSDNVTPEGVFERQMRFVAQRRKAVSLSTMLDAVLQHREPDPDWVAVTFDDGYADFATTALPILERYGIPASVFVPTVILKGGCLFFDQIEVWVSAAVGPRIHVRFGTDVLDLSLRTPADRRDASLRLALCARELTPTDRAAAMNAIREACSADSSTARMPYLRPEDLARLPASVEIGSHSVSHYALPKLEDEVLRTELAESLAALRAVRAIPAGYLSYPFGKRWAYDRRVAACAAHVGYAAALTTIPGLVRQGTDPYEIPRMAGAGNMARFRLALMGLHI